ncbi:ABC transporter permease [Actinoplanes xinjiangensis]|jgi:teichoic acid transport system permease protein|uniref:Transport permease protein n=1 Tax=Actinoplanes xinjiangensis TaxID=512350 RepID=A0A316EL22_9ACTN|nr:ABC transporter permease [Actinoplanes xinjiangensis]PWK29704.1 teichoic acid transport system permease protein [Actinoplanes xinjiangensis]GIF44921.1 transport permease protein [Actinoplanes xinjiangensis]
MTETAVASADAGLSLKELARRNGLSASGRLPSLPEYTRDLWAYRHFIRAHSSAKITSSLGNTKLGAVWQVLTPIINAAVYYVIFGLVLGGHEEMPNFIAYLCIGVFVFQFTQSTVQTGANAITGNLGMIRALHFPRASLPLSAAVVEIRNFVVALFVLMGIVLLTGEPITVQWLLLAPLLLLQSFFNLGLGLFMARYGSKVRDVKQLIPFVMRFWLYGSAVLYPVTKFRDVLSGWKLEVVEANPLLVFIELARHALLEEAVLANTPTVLWIQATVWSLVVGVLGYLYFWRGEKGYGRG